MNRDTPADSRSCGRYAFGESPLTGRSAPRFLQRLLNRFVDPFHHAGKRIPDGFILCQVQECRLSRLYLFQEDDILEQSFGLPRLHSTSDHYFLRDEYWHLLIERMNLLYEKWIRDSLEPGTVIIEFSRGISHGGYKEAYQHISDTILRLTATVFIQVSYQESLRKNRLRYNPDRPDSILEHALEDEKLERLYREDDWIEFSGAHPEHLLVRNNRVPYVVFDNEDDVTSHGGEVLGACLHDIFSQLWTLWVKLHDGR